MTEVANKIEQLALNDKKQEAEIAELRGRLAEKRRGKEETKERTLLGARSSELGREIAAMVEELKVLQRNDPERVEELSKHL